METRLRTIATVLVLLVTVNGFSQGKQRTKPHFDEQHRLVCTCDNKLVKNKLVKEKYKANAKPVDVYPKYEYEKCSKCGIIWIWHCRSSFNEKRNYFTVKPVIDKEKVIHEPDSGFCYIVEYFPFPSREVCECTIKLKKCDQPLYCTVEGETDVYVVTKGQSRTYLERNGKKKEVFVTHKNPGGFTPVKGDHQ